MLIVCGLLILPAGAGPADAPDGGSGAAPPAAPPPAAAPAAPTPNTAAAQAASGHVAPPQTGGVDPAPPTVLVFDPPSVEFGAMYVGKTRHATVRVTNSSDVPVLISRTIPGCSCTKATDPPKEPLAPGASFTIDVSLDGGDFGGAKLRKVVNFLIEGRPTEFLWLHGDVQKVISVSPQVLDVRSAADSEAPKVTLESARFLEFKVLGVEPAGVATFGTEPSTTHELAIAMGALKAAGMPTKLTVVTDHPDADRIVVLLRVPLPPAPSTGTPPPTPAAPSPPSPPTPPSAPAPPTLPAPPVAPAAPPAGG